MRKKHIISFLPVFGLLLLASGCALAATQNSNSNASANTSQAAANTNTAAASSEQKTLTNKTIGVSIMPDKHIGYINNDESPSDPSGAEIYLESTATAKPAPENTMSLDPLYIVRFFIDEGADVGKITSPKAREAEMISFDPYQIPDTAISGYRQLNFSQLPPSNYPAGHIRYTFAVNGQVLAAEASISGLAKDSAEFKTVVAEIENMVKSMRFVEKTSAASQNPLRLGYGYSIQIPDGWMIRETRPDQTNTVSGGSTETYHTFVQTDKKSESFAPIFAFHAFTIDPTLTAEQVFGKRDLYSECVVAGSNKNSLVGGISAFSTVLSIAACQPAAETENFYRHAFVLKETGESPTLFLEAMTSSEANTKPSKLILTR